MIRNRTKRSIALVVSGALLCLAPLSASALGISIVNVTSSGGSVPDTGARFESDRPDQRFGLAPYT